jgi:hypothetical protein
LLENQKEQRIHTVLDLSFSRLEFKRKLRLSGNVEIFPFQQTLQLPSSGCVCFGWSFVAALCREESPLFRSTNQLHHIQCPAHSLPYIRLPQMTKGCISTLQLSTAMFANTLENSQHSPQLIPKSQSLIIHTVTYHHHSLMLPPE